MIAATRAIPVGGSDVGRFPASSAMPLVGAAIISYIPETSISTEGISQ
jgi:hypothetical protein